MKLETCSSISLPLDTIKRFYLNQFRYLEMRVREIDSHTLLIHPIIPFLVADNPLAFCSRIEITMTPVSDTENQIHLCAYINSFFIVMGAFIISIILLINTLAHWILNIGWFQTFLSLWTIYLMLIGGGIVTVYLVKWSVQRFLRQLDDKIKSLTPSQG